ncbi:MAG: hypothetical protein CMN30_05555 [Sandaracinus sp.]|nr:hypothetical protein [Sandaracinus sp.]|tara:strand:- start:2853 stop:3797 length:945 start_codon:yes stop_codon:yes gene_type:complete
MASLTHRRRPRFFTWGGIIGALLLAFAAVGGQAQDRATLIRSLRNASDFRVKVQVAFAMGNTGDAAMRPHLERALRDGNPAVRAAAATALGRLGDRAAIGALRRATRDSSASVRMQAERSIERLRAGPAEAPTAARRVRTGSGAYPAVSVVPDARRRTPWSRVRYVVVLGDISDRSNTRVGRSVLGTLRQEMKSALDLHTGVRVFDSPAMIDESDRRQIERRRLPKLRLEANVVDIDRTRQRSELSVRAEVRLVLLSEPGRDLRGMMSGAATGTEPPRRHDRAQVQRLADRAVSAAVRSALSDAPSALQRAARR